MMCHYMSWEAASGTLKGALAGRSDTYIRLGSAFPGLRPRRAMYTVKTIAAKITNQPTPTATPTAKGVVDLLLVGTAGEGDGLPTMIAAVTVVTPNLVRNVELNVEVVEADNSARPVSIFDRATGSELPKPLMLEVAVTRRAMITEPG